MFVTFWTFSNTFGFELTNTCLYVVIFFALLWSVRLAMFFRYIEGRLVTNQQNYRFSRLRFLFFILFCLYTHTWLKSWNSRILCFWKAWRLQTINACWKNVVMFCNAIFWTFSNTLNFIFCLHSFHAKYCFLLSSLISWNKMERKTDWLKWIWDG